MVAGAVAAVAKYPLPCIIFDLGTATTISVIDEKGYFLGGTICAGVSITLEALANKTALLPHINIEKPKNSHRHQYHSLYAIRCYLRYSCYDRRHSRPH